MKILKKLALAIAPALLISGTVAAINYKDYDKGAILTTKSNLKLPTDKVEPPKPEVPTIPPPPTQPAPTPPKETPERAAQIQRVLSTEEKLHELFLQTHTKTDEANWNCMQQLIYRGGTMRMPYTILAPIVTNLTAVRNGSCEKLAMDERSDKIRSGEIKSPLQPEIEDAN